MSNNTFPILHKTLIWCSGADSRLLTTCSHSVVMKYIQLGLLLLIPSLFAFISAGYWLSTVFENSSMKWLIVVLGGLFWSFTIFSLDRFLVMTTKKSENILRDLCSISVVSRLALAVLLGFVIAHPLVLKMFEPNLKEILFQQKEVAVQKISKEYDDKSAEVNTALLAVTAQMDKLNSTKQAAMTCTEDPELQRLIAEKQHEITAAEQEYTNEVAGGPGSRTGRPNIGPVARSIRTRIDQTLNRQLSDLQTRLNAALATCRANQLAQQPFAEQENSQRTAQYQQISAQFDAKQAELQNLQAERTQKLNELDKNTPQDFLTLSNTLDELGRKNPNVLLWEHLMTAVFCAIDLLAMLIKMTCKPDEYDKKKQADETNRFMEINTQLQALESSRDLYLQNAIQLQKAQAEKIERLQQAACTRERLEDIQFELNKLAEV